MLSRDRDSAVHIGSDITVKVLSIRRNKVKLGIEAPRTVPVWRNELAPMLDEPLQSSAAEKNRTAGMKIVLVVEDEPGHAKLIRKALCQSQGTMVTVAETASSALDALGVKLASPEDIVHPDLVLLDLGLPDSSGLEVLRSIRSVPDLRTTPVVVLSCSDDETVMHQCMEAGANAFVVKSTNYDDFHALVRRIGQFWAGDCLARRRSFGQRSDDFLTAPSDDAANIGVGADDFEEELVGTEHSKRILLAEDDAGHVALIKRALTRANIDCCVDVVGNGVEVIDYLFGRGAGTPTNRDARLGPARPEHARNERPTGIAGVATCSQPRRTHSASSRCLDGIGRRCAISMIRTSWALKASFANLSTMGVSRKQCNKPLCTGWASMSRQAGITHWRNG